MQVDIGFLVGAVGTICAIIFGYIAMASRKKADDHSDGKNTGVVLTEIGYLKSGVDDIKRGQVKQSEQRAEDHALLVAVKASADQSHKRIDEHLERDHGQTARR